MKERPILFSGPMVRAILDGRKTQTRRIVKPSAHLRKYVLKTYGEQTEGEWNKMAALAAKTHVATGGLRTSPFGRPGDLLWVRETWFEVSDPITAKPIGRCCYRATETGEVVKVDGDGFTEFNKDGTQASPWRPSIHMPRWASRLTLRVTGARVERLQEISEEDIWAEGIEADARSSRVTLVDRFARGWDSINGKRAPWASNPWVWVVAFEVHK